MKKSFFLRFWLNKFMEFYAILPSQRGIGFKARNLGQILLGKEVPNPF